ncbi:MAG: hypothetical protein MSQ05_00940 [Akkermansia sp.]|nr:hypothetical protein [Akkermansia sp.]
MRHLFYILAVLVPVLATSCSLVRRASEAPKVAGNPFSTRPAAGAAKKAETPARTAKAEPAAETPASGTPVASEPTAPAAASTPAAPTVPATTPTTPTAAQAVAETHPAESVTTPAATRTPVPSQAQQQSARELLASQPRRATEAENTAPIPAPRPAASPATSAGVSFPDEPAPAMTVQPVGTPEAIPGRLRLGGFGPAAEPNSEDLPTPGPNAVDMRGLRSPKLPGELPMDVDGKIKRKTTDHE